MIRMSLPSAVLCAAALLAGVPVLQAQDAKPFDAAAAFGARVDIEGLRLSPDGMSVSFITPIKGQGGVVYTQSLLPGAQAKAAFYADGKPSRMQSCSWVANDRLVCDTYGLFRVGGGYSYAGLQPVTRTIAVNDDGTKPQPLTAPPGQHQIAIALKDAAVIDWLPDQDGSVLMSRLYVPDDHANTRVGVNDHTGLGVDLVDTRTGAVKHVITPRPNAFDYITDGRGTVRIVAEGGRMRGDVDKPVTTYLYRMQNSEDWHELCQYNSTDKTGFHPVAVDHDLNVAYGWQELNGRFALYSASLDENPSLKLVYSRPDVDLDSLARIGRRNRVVGVSYSTDLQTTEYFAPEIKQLLETLHQALPKLPLISVVDSSVDENRLLLYASSDTDTGAYYILDRKAKSLQKLLATRARLVGVPLAHVKAITYPASDGQMLPAYLTLPPGVDNPRGLPAIVMPHGGPDARDHWGFDWLAQFYANRGYAVLQPEFRGSSGFGDAFYLNNGFKSWDTAIGDVVAAGRWLTTSGTADPSKLGIVGWSYGGYAALQSVAVDPNLFKAIIGIAPVTDLAALVREHGFWNDYFSTAQFVGSGDHMREGSPINHLDKFKQPVLLFHGTADRNVSIVESQSFSQALSAANGHVELVTYEDLDHQLEDSDARADMLRKSDAFLRKAFGMSP